MVEPAFRRKSSGHLMPLSSPRPDEDDVTDLSLLDLMEVPDFINVLKNKADKNTGYWTKIAQNLAEQLKVSRGLLLTGSKTRQSLEETLEKLILITLQSSKAEGLSILKYDESLGVLVVQFNNIQSRIGEKVALTNTVEGDAFRMKEIKSLVNQVDASSGVRNVLCVPILFGDQAIGVVKLYNKKKNDSETEASFSPNDELMASFLGNQIAMIWSAQGRKFKSANTDSEESSKIAQRASSVGSFPPSSGLFDANIALRNIIQEAYAKIKADRISVFAYNDKTDQLDCKVSQDIEGFSVPSKIGIVGSVFHSKKGVNLKSISNNDGHYDGVDKALGYQTKSIACLPVLDEFGQAIGVIQAINKKCDDGTFDANDMDQLEKLTILISSLLQQSLKALESDQAEERSAWLSRSTMIASLLSCASLEQLFNMSGELCTSITQCQAWDIYTIDNDGFMKRLLQSSEEDNSFSSSSSLGLGVNVGSGTTTPRSSGATAPAPVMEALRTGTIIQVRRKTLQQSFAKSQSKKMFSRKDRNSLDDMKTAKDISESKMEEKWSNDNVAEGKEDSFSTPSSANNSSSNLHTLTNNSGNKEDILLQAFPKAGTFLLCPLSSAVRSDSRSAAFLNRKLQTFRHRYLIVLAYENGFTHRRSGSLGSQDFSSKLRLKFTNPLTSGYLSDDNTSDKSSKLSPLASSTVPLSVSASSPGFVTPSSRTANNNSAILPCSRSEIEQLVTLIERALSAYFARQQSHKQMKVVEEKSTWLEAIFASCPEQVWLFEPSGRLLACNRAWEALMDGLLPMNSAAEFEEEEEEERIAEEKESEGDSEGFSHGRKNIRTRGTALHGGAYGSTSSSLTTMWAVNETPAAPTGIGATPSTYVASSSYFAPPQISPTVAPFASSARVPFLFGSAASSGNTSVASSSSSLLSSPLLSSLSTAMPIVRMLSSASVSNASSRNPSPRTGITDGNNPNLAEVKENAELDPLHYSCWLNEDRCADIVSDLEMCLRSGKPLKREHVLMKTNVFPQGVVISYRMFALHRNGFLITKEMDLEDNALDVVVVFVSPSVESPVALSRAASRSRLLSAFHRVNSFESERSMNENTSGITVNHQSSNAALPISSPAPANANLTLRDKISQLLEDRPVEDLMEASTSLVKLSLDRCDDNLKRSLHLMHSSLTFLTSQLRQDLFNNSVANGNETQSLSVSADSFPSGLSNSGSASPTHMGQYLTSLTPSKSFVQSENVGNNFQLISSSLQDDLHRWEFNALKYETTGELRPMLNYIFHHMFDLEVLGVKTPILANFIYEISLSYHCNPFHNFYHATTVTHFLFKLIESTRASTFLSVHQLFALMLSAVVHDVDHPGNTNAYEVNSGSDLALRYNDQSVLENHHCSTAFHVLRKTRNNVLASFSRPIVLDIRKTMIASILATDMAVHFQLVDEIKKRVVARSEQSGISSETPGGYDFSDPNEQLFLCKILLHAADLSNPVRPFQMTRAWAERVSEEFNLQVEREKTQNLPFLNFMITPDVNTLCKNEGGFCSFVVAPMWRNLAAWFPSLDHLANQLEKNLSSWKELSIHVEENGCGHEPIPSHK